MSKRRGFGSIRKLPSGRYQARYTGGGGATIAAPHTFPTKVTAEMWLTDRRRGIDAQHVEPTPITFETYSAAATDHSAPRQASPTERRPPSTRQEGYASSKQIPYAA